MTEMTRRVAVRVARDSSRYCPDITTPNVHTSCDLVWAPEEGRRIKVEPMSVLGRLCVILIGFDQAASWSDDWGDFYEPDCRAMRRGDTT